jgi:predicted DCC family thiol-disulfide oxidoreductase YuxK
MYAYVPSIFYDLAAITPEGKLVKGSEVIIEMWKRLPIFRLIAPVFESSLGSKVMSSG